MSSQPVTGTFQETFCAQYGVPAAEYGATVLRLTLHPHARWLAELGSVHLLAPDRAFVAGVGRLTRWRGFEAEVDEFEHSPGSDRFWRRNLRLRVSVHRMRVLFSEVMGDTNGSGRIEADAEKERPNPMEWQPTD